MDKVAHSKKRTGQEKAIWGILLCVAGVVFNLLGAGIAQKTSIPLFLDAIGTVFTAALGGYLPGILVGLVTNLLKGIFDPSAVYYVILNVLIAICTTYFTRKGYLKRPLGIIICILLLAVVGGGHGAILSWLIYGFAANGVSDSFVVLLHENLSLSDFQAQLTADFLIDLLDKTLTVLMAVLLLKFLPEHIQDKMMVDGWQQAPLTKEAKEAARKSNCRRISLRTRILLLLSVASLSIAAVATGISVVLYRQSSIDDHTKLGEGIAELAGNVIDAERIDEYLLMGEQADGYLETEELLDNIRKSSSDIEYIYVYKIMEDGCHVVFDLDTDGVAGSAPGDIIEFDEAFYPYLPALLSGKEIEPIISDETYGWLLTVYHPVYDSKGKCVCYAAVDISMNQIRAYEYSFFIRLLTIFLGFFTLVLASGLWIAEYNIILPINTIAQTASAFAYNSEEARESSVERIRELDIQTGDEVENLYLAILKTTEDSVQYVTDIQAKTETISQMQKGLILVLADMVESRDKCTGDHVRKTAAYTRIIMEEMRKKGYYADVLTDEFIANVVDSAPLHDVGKIQVPDAILNKPGKLTDEEFAIMKSHTSVGSEIIERVIETVPDSMYLQEAKNLATYHHEKWNGTGYPTGLAGEDIPLSARIMAVADVFDALISKRSYKKPFPFQKALDIIREGAGTHFDPKVAEAFLSAEEEVRKVAIAFGELDEVDEE